MTESGLIASKVKVAKVSQISAPHLSSVLTTHTRVCRPSAWRRCVPCLGCEIFNTAGWHAPQRKKKRTKQIGHGAEAGRADPGPGCDGQQVARDTRQGARTVQTQKVPSEWTRRWCCASFSMQAIARRAAGASSAMIGHRAESREEVPVRGLSGRQALRCVLDIFSLWSVILSKHGNPRISRGKSESPALVLS